MSHPPYHHPDRFPRLQIRLYLDARNWLGPGKADLLELIAETGSISEAGRRMGMSYKRAWTLVTSLNAMFAAPLVARERGGAGGGGACLTPEGARVLDLFRRIEQSCASDPKAEIAALMQMRPPA
ncbi:MAG: LysR family transcriptional regulator [Paracoccus sp. (in: a-proteobacteria)]|nr:LysR family transcriptional regulator [Paracoccus sp. (in: a-proteobacteria)]